MNKTLLTDLYQINMMYAHYKNGKLNQQTVFDLYYRTNPGQSGYAIMAGLEQVVEYICQLSFTEEDIAYLRSVERYDENFIDYLKQFRFTGEIYAVPEGTVVFPHEPLLRVKAPIGEAQLIETAVLNIINHQTLIATKASRITEAAGGGLVMEFGLRRAQGPDAGVYGARAAFIGGVQATSNVLAGKKFGIPVKGTHSHAYVQSYPSEYEAFLAFARTFPHNCILLVDTYDTLNSGVPNAIKTFKKMKEELGDKFKNYGIRLDSGDLAYLSKAARKMLDEAGFEDAIIVASSDLDEYLIRDLRAQGAQIDAWGVGTNLITSRDCPALGGVYKLVAEEENGRLVPKIKVSENPQKITNPGYKKVVRFYDRNSKQALVDLIMLEEEPIPTESFIAFDPVNTWKRKTVENFEARELLAPIFKNGELVCELPDLTEIQRYAQREKERFAPEIRRLINPHVYHVDLSHQLWELKHRLLSQAKQLRT
ncbi:nicotinate phosphoribosyltransferase [Caldalkalibacillus thermarum TA2.A1]|uniref:Nicotinate phosphoribosyltransferase n=1 Tax=Caldalkalibacillus thermarum (strain TA2.A1) TaxID=986075 RepID=F5L6D7_CALTT|nr:nicotinate phosphoribosyltransferase [Caldalkalibacillus thermarum]EGL83090.1 nicotinate phosphoribosyltransferase [Caldalkalibacillus thermarum TA2.A1]QZT32790.1 nicotinate phosphoribosyltransferase [Caldalkalibacillus thermarum TA2.A1]